MRYFQENGRNWIQATLRFVQNQNFRFNSDSLGMFPKENPKVLFLGIQCKKSWSRYQQWRYSDRMYHWRWWICVQCNCWRWTCIHSKLQIQWNCWELKWWHEIHRWKFFGRGRIFYDYVWFDFKYRRTWVNLTRTHFNLRAECLDKVSPTHLEMLLVLCSKMKPFHSMDQIEWFLKKLLMVLPWLLFTKNNENE